MGPNYSDKLIDQMVGNDTIMKKLDYKSKILAILPILCSSPHSVLDQKYKNLTAAIISIKLLQESDETLNLGTVQEPGNVKSKMDEILNVMPSQLPDLLIPFTSTKFDIMQPKFVFERNPFINQVDFHQLISSAVYNFKKLNPISINWFLMMLRSGLHGFLTHSDLPTQDILNQTNLEYESIVNLSLEELKCVFKKDIWCLQCCIGFSDQSTAISHVRSKHAGFISHERIVEENDRRTEMIINRANAQNEFDLEIAADQDEQISEKNSVIRQLRIFLLQLDDQIIHNHETASEITRLLALTNDI